MERNISVIVPFKAKKQCGIDRLALSSILFAKRILDKYKALGIYGFDDAAMVFLDKIAEDEKPDKAIRKQIEFTVKLMMFHQNRNHLARNIINENTAFQKNITNHVLVNLNRLLSVDKRVYSELSQISNHNLKIKEAYDKIVKLENHEKNLVFQVRNQQTIKPKSLQNTFYQIFERIVKQNQTKLSTQLFKESVERKQFKYNLDRLLELQTFRTDVEKHEFLHVMQYGTLEERREAMKILKSAVLEVHKEVENKKEERSMSASDLELLLVREQSRGKNISLSEWTNNLFHNYFLQMEEKNLLHVRQIVVSNFQHQTQALRHPNLPMSWNQEERTLQIVKPKKKVESKQQARQYQRQEQEIIQLKQMIQQQHSICANEHRMYEELHKKLTKQVRMVEQLQEDYTVTKTENSQANLSEAITRQLKEEIHLDKMRYGID